MVAFDNNSLRGYSISFLCVDYNWCFDILQTSLLLHIDILKTVVECCVVLLGYFLTCIRRLFNRLCIASFYGLQWKDNDHISRFTIFLRCCHHNSRYICTLICSKSKGTRLVTKAVIQPIITTKWGQ